MARVLVVDDESGMREMLRDALEEQGHSVCEAEDGSKALVLAQAEQFEVAIIDVLMPVKGGLEALMDLRRKRPGLGVILISGTAQTAAGPFRNLMARLGVQHVFVKPLSLERVLAAVADLAARAAGA